MICLWCGAGFEGRLALGELKEAMRIGREFAAARTRQPARMT